MNTEEEKEATAREEIGRRLSTQTPNGASGSAAVAHHYETVAENGTGQPAEKVDFDVAMAESTAPPASKQTSADKPEKGAAKTKAPAKTEA